MDQSNRYSAADVFGLSDTEASMLEKVPSKWISGKPWRLVTGWDPGAALLN